VSSVANDYMQYTIPILNVLQGCLKRPAMYLGVEFEGASSERLFGLLRERYGIRSKRHPKYPNLVQFKYDQIESPMGEPIVQCARGIILDEKDGWRAVCRPFDKFFNHGEGHAAQIDWSTARVQEKLDGSLLCLWFYDGEWRVSTSGDPSASGNVNGFSFTFEELFWRAWKEEGYSLPTSGWHDFTFMFELTTPYNRVVVPHKESRLTLIGVRHNPTGGEFLFDCVWDLNVGRGVPWRRVREFPLQRIDDVLGTFASMDPLCQEGYVVLDEKFNRIKVKHPGYVALHHLKDGLTPRRLLEIARSGESTEFLAHFPEFEEEFTRIKGKLDELIRKANIVYSTYELIPDQKEFALAVTKHPEVQHCCFAWRRRHVSSAQEYYANVHIQTLQRLLGLKEEE
jgi:hypothetical protein